MRPEIRSAVQTSNAGQAPQRSHNLSAQVGQAELPRANYSARSVESRFRKKAASENKVERRSLVIQDDTQHHPLASTCMPHTCLTYT